tara:strand:- start:41 stop:397 length:357 start_codon:yes stop_codon:yes gene_type:complete
MGNFQWVIVGMLVIWFILVLFFIYMHTEQQVKSRSKKMKMSFLKSLVRNRRLTPMERLGARVGYMGAGFLIAAQWTIEPALYIMGFLCVLFQVVMRKQWNLVALNVNGLFAWLKHFFF